ncbi:aldehyde dehydrogenase family protein, partial [Mesorhizobium sp. M0571]
MKLAQERRSGLDIERRSDRQKFTQAEHAMSDATRYEVFINGVWRAGGDGATLPVINPATEKVFASVASATIPDLDEALASAERSRKAWSSRPAKDRGEILVAAARILAAKVEAAARDLSAEQGKTIAEA